MTAVPLGQGAYKRLYAGTPEVKLLNRWLEANPANLREHSSVLSRPGTTPLLSLDPGTFDGPTLMRGNYSLNGLFDDSLFVVCGENLYRINKDMTVTPIAGVVNGTGHPEVAWQKGAGFERLWIADGLLLQFYSGTTHASGSISLSGTITPGTDIFEVGGVFYKWGTTFSGSDNGSSSHPFVVNPHTSTGPSDPLAQLVLAVNDSGTPGVDYSTTIGGPNTQVSAAAGADGIIAVNVQNGGTGFSSTPTVVFSGGGGSGATATATVAGGAITLVTMVTAGFNYLAAPIVSFTGGAGTGAIATATVGTASPVNVVIFTATAQGTGGNSITLSVTGGTALTASGATLANGGLNVLEGCEVPGGQIPLSLAQVSSFVLVSIANTQQFYWINPGEISIDPLNFASKESSPDNIIAMRTLGDQVAVIGEKSFENWYATGDSTAPFAPIEGRVYARGVIDGTAVVVDDGIIIVGDDGRVYSIGFQSGDATDIGWGVTRISNNGIEERIRRQVRREGGLTP